MKTSVWTTRALLLPLIAATIAFASYASAQDRPATSSAAQVEQIISELNGAPNPYPQVVATVNGQPISGVSLAHAVEMRRINYRNQAQALPAEGTLRSEALDALVNYELLLQAAKARGLEPSADEVVAFARTMQRDALQFAPDSAQRQYIDEVWLAQGLTVDRLDSDPLILHSLTRELTIARIKTEAARENPGQGVNLRNLRSRVADFIQSLRSQADISVLIDTSAGATN
jgi:hypothetical protein